MGVQSEIVLDGDWVGGFDRADAWVPVVARFQIAGGRTTGTIAVDGQAALPLAEVGLTGPRVHFRLVDVPDPLTFAGELSDGTLLGEAHGGGGSTALRLLRVVTPDPRLPDSVVGTYQLPAGRAVFVGNLLGSFRPTLYDFGTGAIRAISPVAPATWAAGPRLLVPAPIQTTIAFDGADEGEATSLRWQEQDGPVLHAPKVALQQEEVRFTNGEVTLAGTLLLPRAAGPHPAVVIIHGSGPQTRACVGLWAHWFARHGIAALAYDKRRAPAGATTGAAWESDTLENLAADALAGVRFLQHHPAINPRQVGLLGSSQGDWVGPLAAAQADDVAFLIVQAAPAVSPARQNVMNLAHSLRADGFSEADIQAAVAYMEQLNAFFRTEEGWETLAAAAERARGEAWFAYTGPVPPRPAQPRGPNPEMDLDPVPVLRRVGCPVLALYGGRDPIVPLAENRARLEEGLREGRCPDYTVVVFPTAEHLMVETPTGAGKEFPYATQFVTGYFTTMLDWLRQRVDVAS